jgi:hypothetical protein
VPQRPVQRGGRFSKKAAIPSRMSSLAVTRSIASSMPSAVARSMALRLA